jgi:hypothetical protein
LERLMQLVAKVDSAPGVTHTCWHRWASLGSLLCVTIQYLSCTHTSSRVRFGWGG